MIQTIIFVSALIGRKAASPGELLARRENGAHLLIEPKAITSPSGQREKQRQRKELRRRAETCEQAHGYSPKHEDSP